MTSVYAYTSCLSPSTIPANSAAQPEYLSGLRAWFIRLKVWFYDWAKQNESPRSKTLAFLLDSLGLVISNIRAPNYYCRDYSKRQCHYPITLSVLGHRFPLGPGTWHYCSTPPVARAASHMWPKRSLGCWVQRPRMWTFPIYSISMTWKLKTPTQGKLLENIYVWLEQFQCVNLFFQHPILQTLNTDQVCQWKIQHLHRNTEICSKCQIHTGFSRLSKMFH